MRRTEHETLEPVGFAIPNKEIDENDREEEDDSLEVTKVERQVLSYDPTCYDEEGDNSYGDLLWV